MIGTRRHCRYTTAGSGDVQAVRRATPLALMSGKVSMSEIRVGMSGSLTAMRLLGMVTSMMIWMPYLFPNEWESEYE